MVLCPRLRPRRLIPDCGGTIMMKLVLAFTLLAVLAPAASQSFAQWGAPAAAAIPEARGYVSIPNAAVTPDKKRSYRAIYNATRAPTEPSQLVPALNMAG